MSQKSNYLEDALINHVLRNIAYTSPTTVYVAISSADPTETGAGTVEPAGAWYGRQSITFGAPTDGASQNSALVDFGTCDATDNGYVASHMAIYDAVTAGNLLYYGPLGTNKTLNTGDPVQIPIGNVTVTEA